MATETRQVAKILFILIRLFFLLKKLKILLFSNLTQITNSCFC